MGSAVSATAQQDLEELHRAEVDHYIGALNTTDLNQIAVTADLISGSGVSAPQLFDVVNNDILEFHQQQLQDSRNKPLAKAMDSLLRALASSGDSSYTTTFNKVLNESKSRMSRNRAKQGLSKVSWYKSRNQIMQEMNNHQPGQTLESTRFLNLLSDNSPIYNRYAAEELYRRGSAEPVVLKKIAANLQRDRDKNLDGVELDAAAWYCRVLGKLGKEDYRGLIESLASDSSAHKKLRKHCKKSL